MSRRATAAAVSKGSAARRSQLAEVSVDDVCLERGRAADVSDAVARALRLGAGGRVHPRRLALPVPNVVRAGQAAGS